jgi:hypothetical protein
MVVDVVRSYWEVAGGLTDVTRARAVATARAVWSGDGVDQVVPGALGQVQSLADELVALGRSNRELVGSLVSAEVDRALGAMGLATRDEVAALQRRVDRLAATVDALADGSARTTKPATTKPAARKRAVKKSAGKQPTPAPVEEQP